MTIAICGKWCLYDGQFGGIPMYNRGVARGYVELGHSVVLICPKWNAGLPDESEVAPGIRVLRFAVPRVPSRVMRGRLGSLGRFAESWMISRSIRRTLDRLIASREVQAAEFAESSLEGYHSVGKISAPHFVRCHTPLGLLRRYYPAAEFRQGTASFSMERSLIRRAPALTTPSRDLSRQVQAPFGVRQEAISVVPNPVESDVYKPADGAARSGGPIVLHVGRLDSRKGGTVLGEAAPHILEASPKARVVFAGEDRPDASGAGVGGSILRGCPEHLRDRLEFVGEVDERRLVELYGQSDICVVPSMIYESFSYTAAQAMSCARPVVASAIGGIPEVVVDGVTGYLTEPGDTAEVTRRVLELLSDKGLRETMGAAGRGRVLELYTPDIVAAANLEVLGARDRAS